MNACMYSCMHAYMYECMYVCMYECMYLYICMCVAMHLCMYECAGGRESVRTCMYVCMSVHACMCVFALLVSFFDVLFSVFSFSSSSNPRVALFMLSRVHIRPYAQAS